MITSIFSKSKPINFIIVSILIVFAFIFQVYNNFGAPNFSIFTSGLALLIVLFYIFIVDFIISRNELTKRNSYGILVFGLSITIFPEVFEHTNLLISNLLILLALRRLFSLHTKKSLKKKFFDAVFWIVLASLFYSWAILFISVVVLALSHYWQNEGKYIAISIFGAITVFVLLILYNIILKDQFLPDSNFDFNYSLDFSDTYKLDDIIKLTIIIAIFLWSLFFYIKHSGEKNQKYKPIDALVILSGLIAFLVAFLALEKTGNEVVYFIFPFSVIAANYIETIKEKWFREIFVWLLILLPFVKLVL